MLTILIVLLVWLMASVALGLVLGRMCEGYPSDEEIEDELDDNACRRAEEGR